MSVTLARILCPQLPIFITRADTFNLFVIKDGYNSDIWGDTFLYILSSLLVLRIMFIRTQF